MGDTPVVRVIAISGSLRSASSNSALVQAAVRLAPAAVELSIYRELADIPPFNPDLDTEAVPVAVSRFRAVLQASDAVLISSPEYAHGVSGVLKNALDWVVSTRRSPRRLRPCLETWLRTHQSRFHSPEPPWMPTATSATRVCRFR